MDVIKVARQLGAAIQADEKYKAFVEAKKRSDEDKDLQALIGEFNMAKMNIDAEINKEESERDQEKIREFNVTLRQIYGKVMCNDSMIEFNKAKNDFEGLLRHMNGIIDMCCEGADPETCEPQECTGSCATCGGCH